MSKNRMKGPPPQSRGIVRQMPVPPGIPQGPPMSVRQELGETDALKYRLAIQKDNYIKSLSAGLADKKKILAQEEENLQLRISIIRTENKRDIGHLDIQQGDRLAEENGKWYILRAPRSGPMPKIRPMPLPAGPAKAEGHEEQGPDGIDDGEPGLDETGPEGGAAPEAGDAAPAEPTPGKE